MTKELSLIRDLTESWVAYAKCVDREKKLLPADSQLDALLAAVQADAAAVQAASVALLQANSVFTAARLAYDAAVDAFLTAEANGSGVQQAALAQLAANSAYRTAREAFYAALASREMALAQLVLDLSAFSARVAELQR
jgi:hypothetical protein